jgi:hypothetical protein
MSGLLVAVGREAIVAVESGQPGVFYSPEGPQL